MIELTPVPGEAQVRVRFTLTLKHEIKPGVTFALSVVAVVGDFNDWDPARTPLQYDSATEKDGHEFRKYQGEAVVEAGHIYEYHFLVDGVHRWPDPDHPHKIPNAQGGENSILETPFAAAEANESAARPKRRASGRPAPKRDAGFGSPEGRLAEAARVFDETMAAGLPPAGRVGPLARAVRLDPYELRYRLALSAAKREAGRAKEAAAECRRALALWPDELRLTLLLGQALLEAGQAEEAKAHLSRVTGDGALGRQSAFDLLELSLRQAQGPEDWKKVLEGLEKLDVDAKTAGLFCEKCLKALAEAEAAGTIEAIKDLADRKLAGLEGHPAYTLFQRVAAFDPAAFLKAARTGAEPAEVIPGDFGPRRAADLESFLKAYRISNVPLDGEDGPSARLERLAAWRRLVKAHGKRWPELLDAYVRQLDRWGADAYKGKSFALAAALWGEAERVDPANPAVLQNLALAHTRMKDEKGYAWYWNKLARTLAYHGEIAPGAGSYARLLAEKHQAFVEGLQKASQVAGDWRQTLALGAEMAREAVSLLAIRQVGFENPLFRCGICREDYAGPEERDRAALLASTGLGTWLKLSAEWSGLPAAGSELVAWREGRLEEAVELLEEGGPSLRRCYDAERAAFKLHRGQTLQQFLQLVGVMTRVAEHAADLTEGERALCFDVARAVMSFPHDLLKPGLLEMNVGLKPDANVRELATGYAILPWFTPAQKDLDQKRFDQALAKLETVQALAPGFPTGRFYLAQCYAAVEKFGQAFDTALKALRDCPADDTIRPHLVKAVPQILLGWAVPLMQKEKWAEAREVLAKAAAAGLPDARISFYEAICLARGGQAKDAQAAARRALILAQKGGDKDLEKEIKDFVPQIPGLMIAGELNKAQAAMNAKNWRGALPILDQALAKAPESAFAQFLKALCHFNLSEMDAADGAARAGLKHADRPGLEEIKKQLQQVTAAVASHNKAALMNPLIAAMNGQRWYEAARLSEKAIEAHPFDSNVRYYRALILFQVCMAEVKSRGGFHSKSDGESFILPRFAKIACALNGLPDTALDNSPDAFDRIVEIKFPGEYWGGSGQREKIVRLLAEASFYSPDLKKGADQLRQALAGVLSQLDKLPGW